MRSLCIRLRWVTKELFVDLRETRAHGTSISIQRVSVVIVEDYKYLEVYTEDKVDLTKNTEALHWKD